MPNKRKLHMPIKLLRSSYIETMLQLVSQTTRIKPSIFQLYYNNHQRSQQTVSQHHELKKEVCNGYNVINSYIFLRIS
jgi:hypothetical protein